MTQAYLEKENGSSSNRSRTYDLPITRSVALPLSNWKLIGAKAIKLGSCVIVANVTGLEIRIVMETKHKQKSI